MTGRDAARVAREPKGVIKPTECFHCAAVATTRDRRGNPACVAHASESRPRKPYRDEARDLEMRRALVALIDTDLQRSERIRRR